MRQRLIHLYEVKTRKIRSKNKREKLNNTDFTIISNNCWGITYEEFGLMKLSPTVGCYFFAEDYIMFVSRLRYYLEQELKFININESKHKEWIIDNGNENCPIGLLEDIEIIFVHYKSPEIAYENGIAELKE